MKSARASFIVQERDIALFSTLVESRVLTAEHVAVLHFGGSKEAAKKRLQKLKAAGFIAERMRRASEPAVLSLAPKAFSILKERGLLASYPSLARTSLERRAKVSPITLSHELEVMDVKASFYSALKNNTRFKVAEFTTWPLLNQFETEERNGTIVKPDGFIRIHEHEANGGILEETFFLEVDRSSETLDTLVSRAASYLHYYKTGGFAVRSGGTRMDFKEYPFRVLMVVKSAERRNNIAERLLQSNPPILTMVCIATFADAMRDPMGSVWITPRDYQTATKDSPYDVARLNRAWQFKRDGTRESFIDERLKKIRLLTDEQA